MPKLPCCHRTKNTHFFSHFLLGTLGILSVGGELYYNKDQPKLGDLTASESFGPSATVNHSKKTPTLPRLVIEQDSPFKVIWIFN